MSKNEIAAAMDRTTAKQARREHSTKRQTKPSVLRRQGADQ